MPLKTDTTTEGNHNEVLTVVHKLSHRTRLRIKKSSRTKEQLSKAQEILEDTPGVQSVEVNPSTGSMLVIHNDQAGREVDVAINEITKTLELLAPEVGLEDGGLIYVSNSLYPIVHKIDKKLIEWSNNTIDLKALLPLAMAYIGLRKMSETRSLLGNISPLVLFYYAFDSYHKLHRKGGQFDPSPEHESISR
jgi:hypothetical protein